MSTLQNVQVLMATRSRTQSSQQNTHTLRHLHIHDYFEGCPIIPFKIFYNQCTQEAIFQWLAPLSPPPLPSFPPPFPSLHIIPRREKLATFIVSPNAELTIKIWQIVSPKLITFKCLELQRASHQVRSKGFALKIA